MPYTRGTPIPRLLGVTIYSNYYFVMYKRQTRSHISVELASSANLGLGVKFAMYTHLTWFHIHTDLASPTYVGLKII